MKTFIYDPNIGGLDIIKNRNEQYTEFFHQGHPMFLIPDFNQYKVDIWLSYLDYLERELGDKIWDQDGGEITDNSIININTGLTRCFYTAYDIILKEGDEPKDFEIQIEGYVVREDNNIYFLATKVIC